MNIEMLNRLVEQAQNDPEFFHALVFDPDRVVGRLPDLGKDALEALRTADPEALVAFLMGETRASTLDAFRMEADGGCGETVQLQDALFAGISNAYGLEAMACGGGETCSCTSGTCGDTCGGSTCGGATCSGDSCGRTCDNSCGYTTNLQVVEWDEFVDPVGAQMNPGDPAFLRTPWR